jgi:hypothetical protein
LHKSVSKTRPKFPTHKVVYLLELNDIQRAWHVSAHRIYQLIEQGRIHVYAQPGRRKRYSVDDILQELGQPSSIGILEAAIVKVIEDWGGFKSGADATPRYPRGDEREADEQLAA